ncbi:hypothetical protein [Nannocystis pusilla]|uniref:hypothetical protein n=1 Tax=Nannocystis pusilla TaxID=889268 RepID=UPI003B8258B7
MVSVSGGMVTLLAVVSGASVGSSVAKPVAAVPSSPLASVAAVAVASLPVPQANNSRLMAQLKVRNGMQRKVTRRTEANKSRERA